ncbi:MAG: KpsF/GutQ family sugar-phosphate isomerase [Saprospiraceae bacterium]
MEDLIIKTALQTIEIESSTVLALKDSINNEFVAVVRAMYESKGRVIVTGIGKSALIAQKIVATLNSTGTPAIFMHAADAIHGDLGVIRSEDIVVCLSKSGDTPEIKVLVPFVKNFGNTLVAMVSNKESYLGKQADYILHTPVSIEADPNNLAPTASTASQMAMGDALASALLSAKGFSREDFAQFHPGGSLGKQLYLRVNDLYPVNEKPAVSKDADIRTSILEMTSKRLGATAVIDSEDNLLGVITDGDLRRMLEKGVDISSLKAEDVMTKNPKTIQPSSLAVKALEIMRKHSISQLVVEENGQYLGMVHLHDLIKEG